MILASELLRAWLRSLTQRRSNRVMTWAQARTYARQAGIAIAREADLEAHADHLAWTVVDRLPNGWTMTTMTEAILASAQRHCALLAD